MTQYLASHQLELIATCSGLVNIYLVARANIWNWFFGIITVSLYLIIFLQVKLYADMALQMVFFCLQFYGFYQWRYGAALRTPLKVQQAKVRTLCRTAFITVAAFASIACLLHYYTDSKTVLLDAAVTALSLVAQWMMSKKWLEHWLLWMLVDVISVIMYLTKQLYFTTGLYTILFLICLYGYLTWRKQLKCEIS